MSELSKPNAQAEARATSTDTRTTTKRALWPVASSATLGGAVSEWRCPYVVATVTHMVAGARTMQHRLTLPDGVQQQYNPYGLWDGLGQTRNRY
jgi:hypothetical protein